MSELPEFYFKTDVEWREWLEKNHLVENGVYLIFYKVESSMPSMRWEEAVKVALCFGWIDSTVKKLDEERRRQYFCPRNAKSVWSKLNKTYIKELIDGDLMHSSGLEKIKIAKKNGSWTALDDVENLIIPDDLQIEFDKNPKAFENYSNFAPSYRKSYLYWLNQAKREQTRVSRIEQIISFCEENKKSRDIR
ncbi:YdeI/OmpD-associated family protein [Aureibaculum sp. 2210JD6-5]|uniref:YdeI/OmpD-associated family protein n=1 Tax=Aureibaculum sp. 2210JD6-5 TaxID=3103957 RepID=UPI002AACA979|nr:YdeI/OmpD-associated family protein [Aureibaculum sp. 2210JD6-5]MDY7395284.1 YdeI/OmpD-associated family protein [Aureibaculum sp. 2210JD6-5]